jgi:anti-anti-sigma factor
MAVSDITRFGDDHNFDRLADDAMGGVFIHDDTDPRAAIVHVFGESTFADSEALAELIVSAIRIGRTVVIDMRECRYMDCATIGVFVRTAKMLGDLLRLVVPRHSQGYRMLDLTGLVRVLHIFESIDEAVAPLAIAPRARLRIV